jgi:hypothetical protein
MVGSLEDPKVPCSGLVFAICGGGLIARLAWPGLYALRFYRLLMLKYWGFGPRLKQKSTKLSSELNSIKGFVL